MGAKGCDEYGRNLRVNQRTTSGEGVCRGTCRGRDTQAVCLDRGQVIVIGCKSGVSARR